MVNLFEYKYTIIVFGATVLQKQFQKKPLILGHAIQRRNWSARTEETFN